MVGPVYSFLLGPTVRFSHAIFLVGWKRLLSALQVVDSFVRQEMNEKTEKLSECLHSNKLAKDFWRVELLC